MADFTFEFKVTWKKSKMWNSNPHCELIVSTQNGYIVERIKGKVSGCGYCKFSSVLAKCISQSDAFANMVTNYDSSFVSKIPNLSRIESKKKINYVIDHGIGVHAFSNVFSRLNYSCDWVSADNWDYLKFIPEIKVLDKSTDTFELIQK